MMNFNSIPNRRQCLQHAACGFGALALHDMLHAADKASRARALDFTPRAKRVIFIHGKLPIEPAGLVILPNICLMDR